MGFELNGNYLFYDKDAVAVERILRTNLLSQENVLGKVKVTGFPSEQWAAESKKLWAAGNNVYLAGLNENGSHHQTKYLREADYLPIGSIIKLDGRDFRVEHVNFTFKSVSLQDMELTKNRLPISAMSIFRTSGNCTKNSRPQPLIWFPKKRSAIRSGTKL